VANFSVFKDKETPSPFREDLTQYGDTGEGMRASKDDHVYMDAMAFGMGACCLQVTFQACNITEARLLYDQLAPLCPILVRTSCGFVDNIVSRTHGESLFLREFVSSSTWS